MITKTYSKDSWHYYIAKNFSRYNGYDTDICTFTRYVLKAYFLIAAITVLVSVLTYLVFNTLFVIFNFLFGASLTVNEFAAAIIPAAIAIYSAAYGIAMIVSYIYEYRRRNGIEPKLKKPSVVADMYKAFKDKTCHVMEFK